MKIEENVCANTEGAGEEMLQEGMKDCPATAPTAPEKFKSVDALARAYGALEAEFTRRSQRIKELEKTVENLKNSLSLSEGSGAEKLRKNAEARRASAKEFDRFVEELGKAQPAGEEVEPTQKGILSSDGLTEEKGADTVAEVEAVKVTTEGAIAGESAEKSVVGGNAELSTEELYARASRDENVRLKIIGDYLVSLGTTTPPLTAGGRGTLATPPVKARNIQDAGQLALQYFKKSF